MKPILLSLMLILSGCVMSPEQQAAQDRSDLSRCQMIGATGGTILAQCMMQAEQRRYAQQERGRQIMRNIGKSMQDYSAAQSASYSSSPPHHASTTTICRPYGNAVRCETN
jgi:hypothetical protein